ncbi:MAG TPA: hypothetical protein VFU63_07540 [Ktedonobacterales bacterium]|nr:hypothetical protein [Ktedonobacterales bacterium]
MSAIVAPVTTFSDEQPASIIECVEAALHDAGRQRYVPEAPDQAERAGYQVTSLYADAATFRDGIAVVEHITESDDGESFVQEYKETLETSPKCASLTIRVMRIGFSRTRIRLWVW